jgi:hypothetical protein
MSTFRVAVIRFVLKRRHCAGSILPINFAKLSDSLEPQAAVKWHRICCGSSGKSKAARGRVPLFEGDRRRQIVGP